MTEPLSAAEIQKDWDENPRWAGVKRDYTAEEVVKLRGSVRRSTPLPAAAPSVCGTR